MKVKEIMTRSVVTVKEDTSVKDIAGILASHRISAVPVLDGKGCLVGIVSEFDLLAREGAKASEIMSTGLVSLSPDALVDDVRQLLVERRIRHLPVLEGSQLVGIVSRADLVAVMAAEWVCQVCGESVRGEEAPSMCPRCHSEREMFVLQEQPPGS